MENNGKQLRADEIVICIPIYNDWEPLAALIREIDRKVATPEKDVSVVIVDDGSTEAVTVDHYSRTTNIKKIEILHLRRNLGHQRAIALGLSYVYTNYTGKAVVIMDGDGQDAPGHIQSLYDCCEKNGFEKIIFAKRAKRNDGRLFKIGYFSYKIMHYLLTGIKVEVGNYSIIPFHLLDRLMGVSEIWNHYAASVFHARLPLEMIPIPRGERIAGEPKMNYTSLVIHGMRAISVFGETVAVRLLFFITGMMLFCGAGLSATTLIQLFTDATTPGWAAGLAGILVVLMAILFLLATFSVLFLFSARNRLVFLPLRDWQHFIQRSRTIHE